MIQQSIQLGVNIDHVATVRQARGTRYPDPIEAAIRSESAGADGITLHLREDRRHIQDRDVLLLKEVLQTRMNLEMAVTDDMIQFAEKINPAHCCLVPERREELTTEGGLDVLGHQAQIKAACSRLGESGIQVSLFIDPERDQIDAALACGAEAIELHTGAYADACSSRERQSEYDRILSAVMHAAKTDLIINAGHGLHYHNVKPIAAIKEIHELNIGHAIMAKALFSGLENAVSGMKKLMLGARR